MRRHGYLRCALLTCLLGAVLPCTAQSKSSAPARAATIERLEEAWCEAIVQSDADALDRILADDFLGTEVDGRRYTKQDSIHDAQGAPSVYAACEKPEDMKTRFFGEVAVVQGAEGFQRRDGSRGKWVFTDVIVRRKGLWQVVASEDLLLPEKK
jgi:ketosteroid isomerase-like protein